MKMRRSEYSPQHYLAYVEACLTSDSCWKVRVTCVLAVRWPITPDPPLPIYSCRCPCSCLLSVDLTRMNSLVSLPGSQIESVAISTSWPPDERHCKLTPRSKCANSRRISKTSFVTRLHGRLGYSCRSYFSMYIVLFYAGTF